MKKLLVICGPTATGKTSLALSLATKFDGELISADSRQVYKGMDIGTGKDIPSEFTLEESSLRYNNSVIGYFTNGITRIWGIDIVSPNQEFSVSHYSQYADVVINDILQRGKLPILVGGTGLYIRAVVDGIDTSTIPSDPTFRTQVDSLSTQELFEMLEQVDKERATSLNNSDKHNPRRLIRALEIAEYNNNLSKKDTPAHPLYETLMIGLRLPKDKLTKQIVARIDSRIKNGFEDEIETLSAKGLLYGLPSETLGYKQWITYREGTITLEETRAQWRQAETKYAKRQMTWFQKERRIVWFDVSEFDYEKKVEELVREWYK